MRGKSLTYLLLNGLLSYWSQVITKWPALIIVTQNVGVPINFVPIYLGNVIFFNQTVPLSSRYKDKNNVNETEKYLILCRPRLFLRLKCRQMNFLAAFNHKLQFCEWGSLSKGDRHKKFSQNYDLRIPDMCKNEQIRGFAKWEIGSETFNPQTYDFFPNFLAVKLLF